MTPAQCKAARGLLDWGRHRLAGKSRIPQHAIRGFELNGHMVSPSSMMPQIDRIAAIRAALEAAGVEFTNGEAPGVRLRPQATVEQ
jgi:hypothetical protein